MPNYLILMCGDGEGLPVDECMDLDKNLDLGAINFYIVTSKVRAMLRLIPHRQFWRKKLSAAESDLPIDIQPMY